MGRGWVAVPLLWQRGVLGLLTSSSNWTEGYNFPRTRFALRAVIHSGHNCHSSRTVCLPANCVTIRQKYRPRTINWMLDKSNSPDKVCTLQETLTDIWAFLAQPDGMILGPCFCSIGVWYANQAQHNQSSSHGATAFCLVAVEITSFIWFSYNVNGKALLRVDISCTEHQNHTKVQVQHESIKCVTTILALL